MVGGGEAAESIRSGHLAARRGGIGRPPPPYGAEALNSLDLCENALCGVDDRIGTYDPSGIQALSEALKVNGALISVNLLRNNIGDDGLAAVIEVFEAKQKAGGCLKSLCGLKPDQTEADYSV